MMVIKSQILQSTKQINMKTFYYIVKKKKKISFERMEIFSKIKKKKRIETLRNQNVLYNNVDECIILH